jgi:DNA modification methylase
MSVRIINADVMDGLAQLSDESVHCVVTSPPYWGLRDYGVLGQIGLEPTLGEHIDKMVTVFSEVRRVLRKDGTLWLNYGDCYATSVNGRSAADTKSLGEDDRTFRDKPFSTVGPVYAELTELAGDEVRGSAGKERYRPGTKWRAGVGRADGKIDERAQRNRNGVSVDRGSMLKPKDLCGVPWRVALALQADGWWLRQDIIWSKPNPMPESIKDRCTKAHEYIFLLAKAERYHFDATAIEEAANRPEGAGNKTHKSQTAYSNGDERLRTKAGLTEIGPRETRNKRSVWEVCTAPFAEAHFATFPPALIEPCIKAGCPEGGMVLDPFGGSGTTGMVCDRLGRSAILIELNPEYAAMAEKRVKGDCPMFSEVTAT